MEKSKEVMIAVYLLTDSDGKKIYSRNLNDICKVMEETALNWDYDDISLRFQIRKEWMRPEKLEKMPEFNG